MAAATDAHQSVRVSYNGQDFVIFSREEPPSFILAQEADEAGTALLSVQAPRLAIDENLLHEPLESLFEAFRVREVLGDFLEEGTELAMSFAGLDLAVREDDVYAREVTLEDIHRLHTGLGREDSLHIHVSEGRRFISHYNELAVQVASILQQQSAEDWPAQAADSQVGATKAGSAEGDAEDSAAAEKGDATAAATTTAAAAAEIPESLHAAQSDAVEEAAEIEEEGKVSEYDYEEADQTYVTVDGDFEEGEDDEGEDKEEENFVPHEDESEEDSHDARRERTEPDLLAPVPAPAPVGKDAIRNGVVVVKQNFADSASFGDDEGAHDAVVDYYEVDEADLREERASDDGVFMPIETHSDEEQKEDDRQDGKAQEASLVAMAAADLSAEAYEVEADDIAPREEVYAEDLAETDPGGGGRKASNKRRLDDDDDGHISHDGEGGDYGDDHHDGEHGAVEMMTANGGEATEKKRIKYDDPTAIA